MDDLRKVEIHKDEAWVEIQFKDLKTGDVFRMFEPDGSTVLTDKGVATWICTTDPYDYVNENEVKTLAVQSEDFEV